MNLLLIGEIIGAVLTAVILFLIAKETIRVIKQALKGRKSPHNEID